MSSLQAYSVPYRLSRRYGWQNQVESNFGLGMVRDMPRSAIPPGGLYDVQDFLVDNTGMLYKRGAVATICTALSGFVPDGVSVAPFDSTHVKVVGYAYDGTNQKVYDCTTGTPSAISGTANVPVDPPKFLIDKVILLDFGTAAPQKITLSGSTLVLGTLGGSPPQGRVGCIHLSRFLIANTAANPNRIYFGPVPNVESTWDTTNAYIDVDEPVTAMASVAGTLLVWSKNHLWRIIGTLPPGDPAENMQLQPVGNVGTFSGRSVAVSTDAAYFAHDSGVYTTNGAGITSLTEKANSTGISSYWRTLSQSYTTGSIFAVGLFKNRYLVVSYTDAAGPTTYHFACFLPQVAWTRFSAGNTHMYANLDDFNASEKLIASSGIGGKILDLSPMFDAPATGSVTDSDTGNAVRPQFTTRVLGGGSPELKSFGHAHVTYDMRDTASPSNPTLAVSQAVGIQATTFAAVGESPLAETTDAVRKRFNLSKDSQGLSLLFQQSVSASQSLEVHSIEVEVRGYTELSEGQ